ncbi:hypothetical protein LCGC14_0392740 [marine sediment metagenome]|uniref:Uncharacterized protein n=1 Tax=marine sediment metagenome TaxID=412755 RepID=A0A0F9W7Z0_9ZZZZ
MDVDVVFGDTSVLNKIARLAYSFGHVARALGRVENLPEDSPDLKSYLAYAKPSFALMIKLWRELADQLGYDWDEIIDLGDERMAELIRDYKSRTGVK